MLTLCSKNEHDYKNVELKIGAVQALNNKEMVASKVYYNSSEICNVKFYISTK